MNVTIFQLENWREIGSALARNKTRTFLTAFGIFWGTAMLALLLGGSGGVKGLMQRQFAGMATNMGGIFGGTRSISYLGYNKGSWWSLNTEDIKAIRAVAPFIESSSSVTNASVRASYSTRSYSGRAIGVEASFSNITSPVIYAGRFINDSDVEASRKVVVLGKNIATELFGNEDPVGKRLSLNGISFVCIGVAGQLGEASIMGRVDDSFYLPETTLRRAFNRGTNVDMFVYTAPPGHSPADSQQSIRRVLSRRHAIHPDDTHGVRFMDVNEMFEKIDMLFMGLSILALFVGAGSLMAGVIGVGNIMWIIVKERTHEFGVRRAIGAKPSDITVQVLSESIILTLVAGTSGVSFAVLILGAVDAFTASPLTGKAGFELSFLTAICIVIIFFILGTAAGTLPSIRAMKIKPIEALRDK